MGEILQVFATSAERTVRNLHASVTPDPVWSFLLLHWSMAFWSAVVSQLRYRSTQECRLHIRRL